MTQLFRGRVRRIHFVGIGGIGMSGIAEVLLALGFEVHGSDLKASDTTKRLVAQGARIGLHLLAGGQRVDATAIRDHPRALTAGRRHHGLHELREAPR